MLVNKPLRSGTVRRGRRWNGCWCSSFSCQTWKIWETHLKEAQRNCWLKEYHACVSTFAECHKSCKINWHATHGADYVRLIQPFHDRWDVLLLKLQVPLILLNDTHFCETRHTTQRQLQSARIKYVWIHSWQEITMRHELLLDFFKYCKFIIFFHNIEHLYRRKDHLLSVTWGNDYDYYDYEQ